jgi:hypothetical protein
MRRSAQQRGRARPARTGLLVLAVAALSVVGLAACGSSPTPAPASAGESAVPASVAPSVPATSQAPSEAPAATATPAPSTTPGATASSTPAPSGAAGSFDACALLTTAELAKILGTDAVQTNPMPAGGWLAGQCAWNGPASGFFIGVGTAASIAAAGDPAAPDAKAKLARFKATSVAAKAVAGIGDAAVASSNGIAAYRGDTYLEITNLGLTEDQLVKIAKLAVARL